MGNKRLIGVLAVTGGVLALGSTAVAFGSGDEQPGTQPTASGPAAVHTEQHHTAPDDEITDGDYSEQQRHAERDGAWANRCGQPDVSVDRAQQIALDRVPSATITEVELDGCGPLEWEIDLRKGAAEYDVDIDASSGEIVDFEVDYDD